MPRALCLTLALVVLPPGYVSADAPDLGANAALSYWQAFAALPRFTDAQQKKLNAEYLTMPLDRDAQEFVAGVEFSLRLLHRGAALRRCEWALDLEEGVAARFSHAEAARLLSSFACLRARLHFHQGRGSQAVVDVFATMTLARHVSQDGSLVGLWIGSRFIEHQARETLALHLPKLDAGTIQGLKARLDALPAPGSLGSAVKLEEKAYLGWFIRKVQDAGDTDALLSLLRQLCGSPLEARTFLDACGGTAAGVLKRAEEVRPCYALLANKLGLPPEEFEKEYRREAKKRAGNPVFKVVFPDLAKMRWYQAHVDVRRALLSAAVAVQQGGKDALKAHPDPVVGGPFEYVAFKGGFELRSKLKPDERFPQPLVLTVGRREK